VTRDLDGQLDQFYAEMGRRISTFRRKSNRTQDDLATSVGLTRTSLTNIERGRQRVLIHTIALIAEELSVDLVELVPSRRKSTQSLNRMPEATKQLLMRVVPEIKGTEQ